ncbi:MAG: hypothetical protein EOP84_26805 [Verrucomicrobiaceae bacterium]|nr:MAG: hypothetical protein EOP84_26805 [Verrucomicrobiaceae bacterium]
MGGWQSTQTIQARFQAVKNAGFAAAVGEVGCNVGFWNNQTQIRDVSVVLDAAANVGMSCLAWHWKDSTEHDSLLTGGQPNDNGNYWFGSKVKNYCLAARTPDIGGAPIGQTIAFWSSASGKYVTTDLNNSNLALAQWATTVGTWERYQVVDAGSGLIALKSLNNGYFLSADLTRADKGLRAAYQNAAIGAWEKFQWVDAGNGEFGLKSNANNFFVSANMNEGQMLQAGWATTIQGWEKFGWHSTP